MLVTNELDLYDKKTGMTYSLKKGYLDYGNNTFSEKAVYELTHMSSRRGSSREATIELLQDKFGLDKEMSTKLVDHLDKRAEEKPTPRKVIDAPLIEGGGIPTRPLPVPTR